MDPLLIHSKIVEKFQQEEARLPEYKKKLNELPEGPLFEDGENISDMKKKIDDIENRVEYNFYMAETLDLLVRYRELLAKPIVVQFVRRRDRVDANDKEREEIVQNYLQIAKKYYSCSMKEKPRESGCCGGTKNLDFCSDHLICTICGKQQEITKIESSYRDSGRVNVSSKHSYERRIHFLNCIKQYGGEQATVINNKVFDDIKKKIGKKDPKSLKIQDILFFLRETGHSKHYEDVVKIYHIVTGNEVDKIGHLESKLLEDFDTLSTLYDRSDIFRKNSSGRTSFINSHYLLYQLLRKNGHPCKRDHLKMLKSISSGKNFHDEMTKKLFDYLGWNVSPLS